MKYKEVIAMELYNNSNNRLPLEMGLEPGSGKLPEQHGSTGVLLMDESRRNYLTWDSVVVAGL